MNWKRTLSSSPDFLPAPGSEGGMGTAPGASPLPQTPPDPPKTIGSGTQDDGAGQASHAVQGNAHLPIKMG